MDVEARALDTVADLIADINPGAMVQRFVIIAEVLDPDGGRAMWTVTDPGQQAWDTLGLLTYGVQVQQAAIVKDDDDV